MLLAPPNVDWSGWADIAQVFGLIALAVGVAQIIWSARLARETGAREAHRGYLQMCFEHAEFSSTEQFLRNHQDELLPELLNERTLPAVQYLWFLSVMLNSLEQITDFVSARGEWRALAVDQVRYHHGAIAEVWLEWRGHYGRSLVGIVEEALVAGPFPTPKDVQSEQKKISVQARSLILELEDWRACSPLERTLRRLRGSTVERRVEERIEEVERSGHGPLPDGAATVSA